MKHLEHEKEVLFNRQLLFLGMADGAGPFERAVFLAEAEILGLDIKEIDGKLRALAKPKSHLISEEEWLEVDCEF